MTVVDLNAFRIAQSMKAEDERTMMTSIEADWPTVLPTLAHAKAAFAKAHLMSMGDIESMLDLLELASATAWSAARLIDDQMERWEALQVDDGSDPDPGDAAPLAA